jgi:hypothetical protein
MAYEWSVDKEIDIVRISATGESSIEESVDALRRLARDPVVGPDTCILLDAREHEYAPSFKDGRRIVKLLRELDLRNPIGLVVSNKLHFGVGRQLSILGSLINLQIEVFTDPESAQGWLRSTRADRAG